MSYQINGPASIRGLATFSGAGETNFLGPSLDLQFARYRSLTDFVSKRNLVTHTRASSGTYVDGDGIIKTATTNLLLRSEEFDQSPWTPTNGTVTTNQVTAPNGSTTADLIAATATAAYAGRVTQTVTGVTANNYSISVYAKAGSNNFVAIGFVDTGFGNARGYFDLSTATSSSTSTAWTVNNTYIQNVGNGWYRCVMQITVGSTDGSVDAQIYSVNGLSTNDVTSGNSVYLWGAQLERSSTVGEYVKTTSTINSAPRFDHNPTTGESLGLLVEESRTNLFLRSQELLTSPNLNGGTLSNFFTAAIDSLPAPNGSTTESVKFVSTATTQQGLFLRQPVSLTAQAYTVSAYIYVPSQDNVSDWRLNVDFQDQDAISGDVFTTFNQWVRVDITATLTANRGFIDFNFRLGDNSAYTGIAGITFYVWGVQIEAGSFPTSYIPTTSATVTRSADVASITGSNFSSWYRQDEGTLFAQYPNNAGTYAAFAINDNSSNNRIQIANNPTSSAALGSIFSSGTGQASSTNGAFVASGNTTAAFAYKTNDAALSANGNLPSTDETVVVPTVNQAQIGTRAGSTVYANGSIRRLTYWPTRLPNSTLQQITQ